MFVTRGIGKITKYLHKHRLSVAPHRTLKTSSTKMSQLQYLDRAGGNQIAFRKTDGSRKPGIVFLSGYKSNMNGQKAKTLETYCEQHQHSFVRFDYQGCGESKGELAPSSKAFDVWKADAEAVLDQLTNGPQILVGSSMGGALMLLLTLENPSRVQALLGIATAAVSFDKPITYSEESSSNQVDTHATKSDTYVIPQDFMDKKYQQCIISDNIPITQPVCLLHGMLDDSVAYQTSVSLAQRLQSSHVDVVLRKEGKHRMSEESDLKIMIQCLENLLSLNSGPKL